MYDRTVTNQIQEFGNLNGTLPKFFQCGCCDSYHSVDFYGDCRDDNNRFAPDELDSRFGVLGWEEVEQPQ